MSGRVKGQDNSLVRAVLGSLVIVTCVNGILLNETIAGQANDGEQTNTDYSPTIYLDADHMVESQPVPDWLAWQMFYGSSQMADRSLQSTRKQQLREHIGLTGSQAELVLNEGYEFVRELEFIDNEARNEISERYGTAEMVEIHLANLPPGAEPPEMPTVPAFTRDGRSLYEAMDSDGLTDLYRDKKQAAFKAHWESLAEILGLYPLVRIETFTKTEMAPGILKTQFTPPPLPTGKALQECLLLLTGTSEAGQIE